MDSIRLALFGKPVSRSPSPAVHAAFGRQFGLDVDYRLVEATRETFPERLSAFRQAGGGCNITLPLKHLAFELANEHTSRAELASAANTLWWTADKQCHADNTDGAGLVRDLEVNLGLSVEGGNVLLLGAGGAASGVLGALLRQKPSQLIIANRTIAKAHSLADQHRALGEVVCLAFEDISQCQAVDMVIDATSLGHSGDDPGIPTSILHGDTVCYSLNYGPAAEPLRNWCRRAGVAFHDGLGMLVEQAALSFEIWTGRRPETAPVLAMISNSTT